MIADVPKDTRNDSNSIYQSLGEGFRFEVTVLKKESNRLIAGEREERFLLFLLLLYLTGRRKENK